MEDMQFIIPKKLHDKHGYDKKVASGKWFNFEDVNFKLKYVRESKKFRTELSKIEGVEAEINSDTPKTEEESLVTLKKYCKLLIGSIILDWDMKAKVKNAQGKLVTKKAPLNPDLLARFFAQYYTVLDEILLIFVDNKQFHSIDKKK